MTRKKQIKLVLSLLIVLATLVQGGIWSCNDEKTSPPVIPSTPTSDTAKDDLSTEEDSTTYLYEGRKFSIGFYNTENLFDTKDDPGKNDAEFLPSSTKAYTSQVYTLKLQHIAQAIAGIEHAISEDTLALVGLVEVENLAVLEDLILQSPLKASNFSIIHRESSDPRGIDAALLYNPLFFTPKNVTLISPFPHGREILQVTGTLLGQPTHIFINHWTSRMNGSEPKRILYAQKLKSVIDNIRNKVPKENIIVMGDFNDNPTDKSIKNILNVTASPSPKSALYNPFYTMYTKGLGTGVYNNAWDMFDQIMVLTQERRPQQLFDVISADVLRSSFLLTGEKPIPTAPKRFYEGNTLLGGYSDHLPIFVQLQ